MLKIQDDTYVKRTLRFLTTTLSIFIITFILAIIFSPSADTIKNYVSIILNFKHIFLRLIKTFYITNITLSKIYKY